MELLMPIISVAGDDRIVVLASGVCTGWRDALGWGLTNLSLSWCQQNMNNITISFAQKFTKLQVLTLRQIKPQVEDSAVEAVANYCYDLHELDLSRSFRLTDRSLYALANGCPRLTKLNISGCTSFSDSALIYLSCHCKNLKCLNLCGCVKAATDGSLQAIARNCRHLQSLNRGSGSSYLYGLMDHEWKERMTQEDAGEVCDEGGFPCYCPAHDGASGGVVRTVTINADGVKRSFHPVDKLQLWHEEENSA